MFGVVDRAVLLVAVAALVSAGCSDSHTHDVAGARNTTEAQSRLVSPAAQESSSGPLSLADGTRARPSGNEQALPEIGEAADSDEPGGYLAPQPNQTTIVSGDGSPTLDETAADGEAAKRNGRADGDDATAATIVAKADEIPDDAPLDNGREPTAKPIPEAQRVAVTTDSAVPDANDAGRDSGARPGTGVPPTSPEKDKPTAKPAAPSRKTLADLAAEVQVLDKDDDGQLGVYEWPREKLTEFKTLDSDKDGFLTPAELFAGQKKTPDAEPQKTDQESAESSKVEEKEKPAATSDKSPQSGDAKSPDQETPDGESSDKKADEAETTNESSDENNP